MGTPKPAVFGLDAAKKAAEAIANLLAAEPSISAAHYLGAYPGIVWWPHAALPLGCTFGKSTDSSVFIFASASSIIHICEL
jgi:hypothetical protein